MVEKHARMTRYFDDLYCFFVKTGPETPENTLRFDEIGHFDQKMRKVTKWHKMGLANLPSERRDLA